VTSDDECNGLLKPHPPGPALHPIDRLPVEIFILIPHFFTDGVKEHHRFLKNLITMTHVCRSWRNVLLSTPNLWTHLDFSNSKSKQAEEFLGRSGEQLLDVYQTIKNDGDAEPFLSIALRNTYRLRRLEMTCSFAHIEHMLAQFTMPAPELKHLGIATTPPISSLGAPNSPTPFSGVISKTRKSLIPLPLRGPP